MLICPICGFRNTDQNTRCLKCQALLKENTGEFERTVAKHKRDRFEEAEFSIAALFTRLKERNPLRRYWELPLDMPYRFPFTAGGLSMIIPGLGQIYNNQRGKAFLLFMIWLVIVFVCLRTIKEPYSNFLLVGALLFWLAVWSDGVTSAVRINGGQWSLRNSIAMWFGAMFVAGLAISGAQFFGQGFVSFVRITNLTNEWLKPGDVVMVNHMAYWFGRPRLGDFVYFDPPRFKADKPPNEYLINIKDYFQVVSGVGGDTVKKENGRFLINGRPLMPGQSPLGGDVIPEWEFKVPTDRYFVPVTSIPQDSVAAFFGVTAPPLFAAKWNFTGWPESTMIEKSAVYGRSTAIINPPHRRRWF
jgi:Signal peptidase, peptidase S26